MFLLVNNDMDLPQRFIDDPIMFFYNHGINIKAGETQFDENGVIKDDPNAVKNIPELGIVGKKINREKGKIKKTGMLFYEVIIMEYLRQKGLVAPTVVGIFEGDEEAIFFTKKIVGTRGVEILMTENAVLIEQATLLCEVLNQQYAKVGIERKFEMKDMIFEMDNGKVVSVMPTDFEKTKINMDVVDQTIIQKIIRQYTSYDFSNENNHK